MNIDICAKRLEAGVAAKNWGPQALFDAEQSSCSALQPWHMPAACRSLLAVSEVRKPEGSFGVHVAICEGCD